MTIIGIDYGMKRVGVAVSDAGEVLAFPEAVLPNDALLLQAIQKICTERGVRLIVLGHSKDLKGNDNSIMSEITTFKDRLEQELQLPILFEQEFWSSAEAVRFQGHTDGIDASAAAIILQRFLDKQRAAR